jgi:hypothetical protein
MYSGRVIPPSIVRLLCLLMLGQVDYFLAT